MFVRVPSRRRQRAAIATYLLVAICVVMFLLWWSRDSAEQLRWIQRFGVIPAEWHQAQADSMRALLPRLMRFVSAVFIHADGLHLIGNLVFLLVFGVSAERPLGAMRLVVLFVFCGALANGVGAWWMADSEAPIIGASGAVSALVGAYATLFPNSRLGLVLPLGAFFEFVRMPAYSLIGLWVLVQGLMFALSPGGSTVAWPVHLAGFTCGVGYALMSREAISRRLRN